MLLPQFAFLLFMAYDDMRELRHELQFHTPRAFGCTTISFYTPAFVSGLLGIIAVIGLCGLRWWSRWLYAVLAVVLFVTSWQEFLRPPAGDLSFLLVPGLVLVTLALCFVPGSQSFHSPPPNKALQRTEAGGGVGSEFHA